MHRSTGLNERYHHCYRSKATGTEDGALSTEGGEGRSGVGKYYIGSIGACNNSVITVNCQLSVLQP